MDEKGFQRNLRYSAILIQVNKLYKEDMLSRKEYTDIIRLLHKDYSYGMSSKEESAKTQGNADKH